MITKYEVFKWYSSDFMDGGYSCELITDWLVVALWKMWRLKRNGAICIKLEWHKKGDIMSKSDLSGGVA